MNKFIGGLLVATLLARPTLLRVDFIAYEIYRAHSRLIAIVRKYEDEQLQIIEERDIDELLVDIDTNKQHILRLTKHKNRVFAQIQTTMQEKAKSRERMTDEQINAYQQFTTQYSSQTDELNQTFTQMNIQTKLHETKKEIAKKDTDFSKLYRELKAVNDSQYETIFNLNGLIEAGQRIFS